MTDGATTDDQVLERLLGRRYSCRAFRPAQVPAETIARMFALAQRTASWCNSQAWQVHLTSGERTTAFARALTRRAAAGAVAPDIGLPTSYQGAYLDRRRAAGYGLYSAVGVARDDRDGRERQHLENFRFFGAPHVAVISTPAALGAYGAVDCGGYVSTLMTAAQSLGVATIAQGAIAMYADVVHEHLGIPQDRNVVCAVSFGYADESHPANAFRTDRAELSAVVSGLPPTEPET